MDWESLLYEPIKLMPGQVVISDPTGRLREERMSKPKRLLGDQRIFQAIFNDLKMRHELVTDQEGNQRWAYIYEGIDPYELEDKYFPTIVKTLEPKKVV